MSKAPPKSPDVGPFTGFGRRALIFFEDLAANQNRDWFLAHKDVYDGDIRRPMEALVESLVLAFAAHDIPLTGSAKASIFRIHRDVRFAKDKSPYKTHAGAVMSRDGTKSGKGILYVQVGGVEQAFVAIGFYGPEPDDLAAIRHAIATAPEQWLDLERSLEDMGLTLSRGSPSTRMPKGYEALSDSPIAGVLKYRNFIISRTFPPERIFHADLVDDIVAFAGLALPLLEFGCGAIDRARGARAE